MEDYDYYYEVPFNIASKKEVDVLNNKNQIEFVLQRFNQNLIDFLLSVRNPSTAVNIALKDTSNKKLVQAIDAWSLRRKFHITYSNNTQDKIIATETNNVKLLNKKLEFEINGGTYTISKDAFNKRTTMTKDNEEFILMERNRELGLKTNYIKILNNGLDVKLAICILHAFEIGV
ncbi:hypothetical protein JCM9140_2743 [Halalkalibacter wakoensis JCM 9140]|uniref:Tubby C-terminal domain-containing protein n=1 Tax=Halalkalibacter wakoensis JCM 9140 TaxID=1236970 RepID=W4Q5L8_9BACI|nr:hypothetical protein [Halalkalibacter wakoensis]GAE26659.1 hypothetical protein JCM9140_2743 [Halalkalibacter wakoensis JCM 9140]